MLIGGIEAGGTKMVCAVAETFTGDGETGVRLIDRMSIPTGKPEETLDEMITYFKKWEICALGIGCFGPVDLDKKSKTYGHIMRTPKKDWRGCDVVGTFKHALNVPVGFDTDVNGAILGEVLWGAAKDCDTAIYITIGTGIGVGVCCNGALVHGLMHPEAGHILLAKHPSDSYEGCCPFHPNCAESLASGPSIEARYGKPAAELSDREDVWELEAYYIAQAVANYILTYSPQKIVLWGGVMHQPQLFAMVREKVKELLGGYIAHPTIKEHIEEYIVAPALGENPGIMGAFALGIKEMQNNYAE